ncbi:TPA: ATP synthase subunit I [Legionella anisa]|uniref:ATP synthase subunit I n=1 Tax=Legionella anisa TaxID=28082 RepID=UPI00197FF16C|nr:ATP synthase subunit I [Legionella anisa]MBN5937616.1 ATP synthase subunit I [Legionella anisa]
MMMTEGVGLIQALLIGLLLGALFFGGLLWTIRQGVVSKRPALWFLSSFLLRTIVTLGGFYFILTEGQWMRLLLCLLGFTLARFILTRRFGEAKQRHLSARINHAS